MSTLRKFLYLFGKVLGDLNAIKRGRVKRRVGVRLSGKLTGRLLKGIFK